MNTKQLKNAIQKGIDTVEYLDLKIQSEKINMPVHILFEYSPLSEDELDSHIHQIITTYAHIFRTYLDEEEFEKLSKYTQLFELELERILLHINDLYEDIEDILEIERLIINGIKYTSKLFELEVDLLDNFKKINNKVNKMIENE